MGLAAEVIRRLSPTTAWEEPVDMPWRDATFCVIDLETTGLDLRRDEIISVGAVKIQEGRIAAGTLYLLACPPCEISEGSMSIHSILPSEVEDCPPIDELLDQIRDFAKGSVVVAHAAWIEKAFLNRALKSRGERLPRALVDTAAMARHLGLAPHGDCEISLEYLAHVLELPAVSPHHALGDAMTTAMTFLAMVSRLEERGEDVSIRGLAQFGS